ncbi:MAG: hypothetical protein ACRCZH_03425 [Cetobacterium sp.]
MGLFSFFKKKINSKTDTVIAQETLKMEAAAIPETEKKYYKEHDYYTVKIHEGTPFENEVITFEKRKETSIPSKNGLYVPEILMLHFSKKYPNPKNGYPGYWWFRYGVRDVGSSYKSLEERGFIRLNEITTKYELTELGKLELEENAYVYYMHRHSTYTTFTIWDLNQMLGNDNKSNYIEIIEKRHAEINKSNVKNNNEFMSELKKIDPKGYKELKTQEDQIAAVQAADVKYAQDKDLDWIIGFWEQIWANGGLKFNGSTWTFKLPDLYIKAKRYEDALAIVMKIKKTTPQYIDKANKYITKIEERKTKEANRKK